MDFGLKGKNIFLIGGHSNIGRDVSLAFAKEGAGITIGYGHDKARADKIAEQALSLGAAWADTVQLDATEYGDVKRAVDQVLEHGDIDCIYLGIIWAKLANFLEFDPAEWIIEYKVGLQSAMNVWHYAIPYMQKAHHGNFINVASTMGRMHAVDEPVYGAMKAALIHLGQTIAMTVGKDGIRINFIAPGPTPPADFKDLPINSGWHTFSYDDPKCQENIAAWNNYSPLGQFGNPMDNAYAALYLASDLSGRHLTGQIIGTDGGTYMPK